MREEIIKMAREAGFEEALEDTLKGETLVWTAEPKHLERFFHMAQAAEREACAKLEKELMLSPAFFATMDEYNAHKDAVLAYRNLILARGQT